MNINLRIIVVTWHNSHNIVSPLYYKYWNNLQNSVWLYEPDYLFSRTYLVNERDLKDMNVALAYDNFLFLE